MNSFERWKKKQDYLANKKMEATIQRWILIGVAVILAAYFFVIYLLIKGVFFGKSKSTRIFSALGLVAIAIGTTVLVKHIRHKYMDDHAPETPTKQHVDDHAPKTPTEQLVDDHVPKTPTEQLVDDHAPKTPTVQNYPLSTQMIQYLEMDEQSFRASCYSFLDSSQIGRVTPNVRTNLATVLVFRDKLRPMGVSDEAFKQSYESGGFEGLFQGDAMTRLADPDPYYSNLRSDLKSALDKCLSYIQAPYWKQQELKIRTGLYYYLRDGKSVCDKIIDSVDGDGDSMVAAMRTLEAMEIVRVLRQLGMMSYIKRKSDMGSLTSSEDCAKKLIKGCNCRGIAEKWIQELGKWCVAWDLPDNAPNGITFLLSPGFPFDKLTSGRLVNDSIVFEQSFVLVHNDGEIKDITIGKDYNLRKIFDERELLRDLTQLKYLTPRGILTPFVAEQTAVRETSEHKSENAGTRSMKTEVTISPSTHPETTASKVVDAPTELPPVVSPQSQAEPKSQTVVPTEKNPHFEAAKKHDWQAKCQKEWGKTFSGIQRTFSIFGGFQLAQPPIDGIEFDVDSEDIQKGVPLQKKYRYFQKADLDFFHGALVEFTLKVHFAKKYSKGSITRECKALQDDVIMNLKRLNKPELGVVFSNMNESWDEMDEWRYVKYGRSPNPSIHGIRGEIVISCALIESDDGYDLTLTVNASDGLRDFIKLVLEKEVDEAGEELEPFDKKPENKVRVSSIDDEKELEEQKKRERQKELEEQKRLEAQKNNKARYERALAQMNQREKAAKDRLGRQYKMRMIRYNYYSAEFDKITEDYKRYRENLRIKYGIDKTE